MVAKSLGPALATVSTCTTLKKREEDEEDLELVANPVSIVHLTRHVNPEIMQTNHHLPYV